MNDETRDLVQRVKSWDSKKNSVYELRWWLDDLSEQSDIHEMKLKQFFDIPDFDCSTLPEILQNKKHYPIWAADCDGLCLTGTKEFSIKPASEIIEVYEILGGLT